VQGAGKLQRITVHVHCHATIVVQKALIGEIADVDLRLLRIFKAVVDAGGFSAAELELNIGRSTVSRHVADLEARLGFVLCTRGRSGFALTEEGRLVHEAAQRLLGSVEAFRNDLRSLQADLSGSLQLALFDKTATNPKSHIPQAVREFRAMAPAVSIELSVASSTAIEAGVLDGRFHLGVTPDHRRSDALRYLPLFTERMDLYCGRGHPLYEAGREPLTLDDLRHHDYVGLGFHSPNMEVTHRFGLRRRASVTDQEAVATLVLSGCYIGFLPDHYAEGFVARGLLRRIAVPEVTYDVLFVAVARRSPEPTRVAQAFLERLADAHRDVARAVRA
jgi:LysR family transcriptional regulator, transcriptional activator for bauABCD operon